MIAFSAKDSNTGLDIDPGQTAVYFENLTTVDGIDYYRETMGIARPQVPRTLNVPATLNLLLLH